MEGIASQAAGLRQRRCARVHLRLSKESTTKREASAGPITFVDFLNPHTSCVTCVRHWPLRWLCHGPVPVDRAPVSENQDSPSIIKGKAKENVCSKARAMWHTAWGSSDQNRTATATPTRSRLYQCRGNWIGRWTLDEPVNGNARVSCVRQRMPVVSKLRPQPWRAAAQLFLRTTTTLWFVACGHEQAGRASMRQAQQWVVNAHHLRISIYRDTVQYF